MQKNVLKVSESTRFIIDDDETMRVSDILNCSYKDPSFVVKLNVYDLLNGNKMYSMIKSEGLLNSVNDLDLPKEKIYRVAFYDTDDVYGFYGDSKVILRNGETKEIRHLKEGDLCMTSSEITPLDKIGVVKYVFEEYPTENFYSIDLSDELSFPIGVSLSNGVYVVCGK